MNRRIEEVRKAEGLTQEEFAKRLKMSRNFIWMVENGKREVSDRTISDICRIFGVREEWLRTGEGPMKEEKPSDIALAEEFDKLLTAGTDDFRKALIAWLIRMPPEHWKVLETIILDLLKDVQNLTDSVPTPHTVHDMTPDEIRAEMERQLAEEASDREKGIDETSGGGRNASGADCG